MKEMTKKINTIAKKKVKLAIVVTKADKNNQRLPATPNIELAEIVTDSFQVQFSKIRNINSNPAVATPVKTCIHKNVAIVKEKLLQNEGNSNSN